MKRRLAILVIGPLLALLGCTVAWAFWTTTGSGTASASTGTLNAPTAVTATSTTGTGTVQVSWTVSAPAAGGLVPSGYYVTRVRNSDGVASSACATSPTVVTASSLCTDSAVADGTYHYVVTGVKASWTASSGASGNVTIVNDTTAPIVAVASVNGSARTFPFVTNTNVTTIGGTCGTLAGDIATVNPRINGAATAPISTPCSAGTWTLTLSTVLTAEATSTLSAIQTDAAGNTGTAANQTVTIDKTSPVVSVTSVNGSARSFPYFTNASLTTIGGTCGTLTGDSTTITPLIAGIATIPATATCSAGTWTLTLTPAITTEATRTLTATQTDTAGNSGTAVARTVTIDKTAPVVVVTTVNGITRTFPHSTNTNVTTIGGTCGTLTGDTATVSPRINGAATAPSTTSCAAGSWTLTLTTVLTAEATSTLSAIQTDAAGNTGTAANQTVTIDKTSPVVSVTSVNGSARSFPYFTNASLTTIGGTCGTLTGDSTTITPLIAGIATIPATATCSAGTWTLTLTPAITTEATRTLTATQTDTAGNSGTAVARTVTIDKTAPVVVSVQLANGSSSASGRADSGDTVSINYGEQMDGATFCSSWNNSGTNTLTGNGNVTVTITENGNSDTLTVTASPCAGLKVGSIALGANYVSSTTSFNGNGSNVSEISLSTAGILTIKLGTGSNSPTGASASTPIYTPVSGLSDLAGNALPVAAKTGTSSSF